MPRVLQILDKGLLSFGSWADTLGIDQVPDIRWRFRFDLKCRTLTGCARQHRGEDFTQGIVVIATHPLRQL